MKRNREKDSRVGFVFCIVLAMGFSLSKTITTTTTTPYICKIPKRKITHKQINSRFLFFLFLFICIFFLFIQIVRLVMYFVFFRPLITIHIHICIGMMIIILPSDLWIYNTVEKIGMVEMEIISFNVKGWVVGL